eukprot:SAG22_NODE_403_length_11012_cov_12.141024_9_plen_175_part_00
MERQSRNITRKLGGSEQVNFRCKVVVPAAAYLHGRTTGLVHGEVLVGHHAGEVGGGDPVEAGAERELVDDHVVQHTVRVPLEALVQRGLVVLVVVDPDRLAAGVGRFVRPGLPGVLGNVLVEAEQEREKRRASHAQKHETTLCVRCDAVMRRDAEASRQHWRHCQRWHLQRTPC